MPKYIFKEEEWMDWSAEEYHTYTLLGIDGGKYKIRNFRKIKGGLPGKKTHETWIGVNVFGPGGVYESHKHETSRFYYVLAGRGKV